jgi:formylglycine-generating enzyme required for sulfatase activity
MRLTNFILGTSLTLLSTSALAQPDSSGIDFVTISQPGNAPWTGNGGFNNNKGQVNYEYRIGRFEVTTAQWAEFMNAALDRPSDDHIPHAFAPTEWGGVPTTPINPGGQRFNVPAGNAMLPAGGIDWRTCAIYCNWLHNNKSSDRSAFLSGAYDVSTFGYIGTTIFTDQVSRSPGARYYIPSADEWMKAAHWNPNRNGPGLGGWDLYSNGSDNPYTYGPPGVLVNGQPAMANAGWDRFSFPGHDPYNVALGAYTGVTSPWGLFDVAGGTSEWTEATYQISDEPGPRFRFFEGSAWTWGFGNSSDHVRNPRGAEAPSFFGFDMGFRVAAAVVPAPTTAFVGAASLPLFRRRR